MEMFTVDWGRSWLVRLLGRNPLVRSTDRWETFAATLAVIAVITAVPIAAAFGTAMKDSRSAVYAQQALNRHETPATALENATLNAQVYTQTFHVRARWAAAGTVHVGTVSAPAMVHPGDRIDIWTDESGSLSRPPIPVGSAGTEAVGWAVLSWMVVAGVVATGLYGLHRTFNRARYAGWDHDLDSLAGNDGGRAAH